MKKHALNIILYATDAAMYDSPWSMWEVRLNDGDWKNLFVAPMWQSGVEYRRKPNAPICDGEQFALLETVYRTLSKRVGAPPSTGYAPPPVTPNDRAVYAHERHNDPMYAHERIDAETKNRRSSTQFLASEIDKERVGRINGDKALSDRLEVVEAALASLQTQLATMPNVETVERIVAEKLAANITPPQNDTERDAKRLRKCRKLYIAAGWNADDFDAHFDSLPDHD